MSTPDPGLLVGAVAFQPDDRTATDLVRRLASLPGRPFLVDNSTTVGARSRVSRAAASQGVSVFGDGVNRGTAGGLNLLLAVARRVNLAWVLYFDQDSQVITPYDRFASRLNEIPSDVAVVGSRYDVAVGPSASGLEEVRYLISSGCFFRTSALVEVDGFDETFFLDLVDHEICLRLRRRGWRLLRADDLVMAHQIGEGAGVRVGRLVAHRHPAWRRRLIWRNSWWWLWREGPRGLREPARGMALRFIETVGGAIRLRSWTLLTAAMRGTMDAATHTGRRRGLRASQADAIASRALPDEPPAL